MNIWSEEMIRYASLFSGIGGFELGIRAVDPTAKCVFASENDKYAKQIYKKNFGVEPYDDITEVNANDIPDHDILCAGFPCQAFSIAGQRRGFEDCRGTLFFEIMRVAKAKRPTILFLENVKGLLSHNEGKTMEVICESLTTLGYLVNYDICNSKNFGVPQNRERVFFICTHITALTKDGQMRKTFLSETIINDFLFQILLNNLDGVKRLQERESKDSIIGLLLLKEIANGLKKKLKFSPKTSNYLLKIFKTYFQSEHIVPSIVNLSNWDFGKENIKDGISILTEEKWYRLDTEKVWRNIDFLLKKIWEENYLPKNTFTISTALKQIINWKTYTYSQMLLSILTLIVHLRNSSRDLWTKMLSDLILIRENTSYARIANRTEEEIVTESNNMYKCDLLRESKKYFVIGHLRGRGTRQIFPIREKHGSISEAGHGKDICSGTIETRNQSGQWDGSTMLICDSRQGRKDQIRREMLPPLRANTGAGHNNIIVPEMAGCLTGGGHSGGHHSDMPILKTVYGARRLTPVECERLQGFPDNWTGGISDTQRYKCLGNAVTVNVVEYISGYLLPMLNETKHL